MAEAAAVAIGEFRSAIFDDLNAPEAQAALFTFIKAANRELDRNGSDRDALARARDAFAEMDGVLDIIPTREIAPEELAVWVDDLIQRRQAARARRDFAEADRIRAELAAKGVVIEDSGAGTSWKWRG